jgi:hypothetical protein
LGQLQFSGCSLTLLALVMLEGLAQRESGRDIRETTGASG